MLSIDSIKMHCKKLTVLFDSLSYPVSVAYSLVLLNVYHTVRIACSLVLLNVYPLVSIAYSLVLLNVYPTVA